MKIKSLVFLLAFPCIIYAQSERLIRLDTKTNALLLTASNAKLVGNLTPNQAYTISVTANNVHAPMQGAFFALAYPTGGDFKYVASGQSFTFVPVNSSFQLAAFYVDWSSTADNSGTITVNINGPTTQTLTIDAKNDAILLDTAKTQIVGNLARKCGICSDCTRQCRLRSIGKRNLFHVSRQLGSLRLQVCPFRQCTHIRTRLFIFGLPDRPGIRGLVHVE